MGEGRDRKQVLGLAKQGVKTGSRRGGVRLVFKGQWRVQGSAARDTEARCRAPVEGLRLTSPPFYTNLHRELREWPGEGGEEWRLGAAFGV